MIDFHSFHIMGVLNVTPDSFSDGNRTFTLNAALAHAERMIAEGATIIDIGGESSRPGAFPVDGEEELRRVLPVVQHLRKSSDIAISVDTSKPDVMRAVIDAGADMINDVYALQNGDAINAVAQHTHVALCLMHMQGLPRTMQVNPQYQDVVQEIGDFLEQRIQSCLQQSIARQRLVIDPGFGFGKTVQHNLQLIRELNTLVQRFDLPLLIGVSRKSTIGTLLDAPVDDSLAGSLALATLALERGAKIIRTHDVKATKQAASITLSTLGCAHAL